MQCIQMVYPNDRGSFPGQLKAIDDAINAALPSAVLMSDFSDIKDTYQNGIDSLNKEIQEEIAKREDDDKRYAESK